MPSYYRPIRRVLLCCFTFKSVKATSCFWHKLRISKLIVRNVMGLRLDSIFQRDRNINYLGNYNNVETWVMVTPKINFTCSWKMRFSSLLGKSVAKVLKGRKIATTELLIRQRNKSWHRAACLHKTLQK